MFGVNKIYSQTTITIALQSGSKDSICGNSVSVSFTATVTNCTSPTYQWYVNDSLIGGQNGQQFSFNNFKNGDIVTCKQTNTSDPCKEATSNGIKIVIKPNQAINWINSSGSVNQTMCQFTAITPIKFQIIGATNATVSGLPNGVSGSFNNGEFTISGTPTQNGTFNYQITTSGNDLCGSAAQTSGSLTTSITPDPSIMDYSSSKPFTNCSGNGGSFSLEIDNTSTTKTTNATYEINWGDGSSNFSSTSFTNTLSHVYQTQGYFPLVLKVTGTNGCVATKTYSVYNGNNPSVPFTNPGASVDKCAPFTFQVPSTTNNNPIGTIYVFNKNDGTKDDTLLNNLPSFYSHTFESSSCGALGGSVPSSYFIKITASNQCGTSITRIEPISTNKKPTARFDLTDSIICINSDITLTNTSLSSIKVSNDGICDSTTRKNWTVSPNIGYSIISGTLGSSNPNNNPNNWGSTKVTLNFTNIGTYKVSMIMRSDCGNDTITKTICVNAVPTASFTTPKDTLCAGENLAFTSTANTPTCGNNLYTWSITQTSTTGCSTAVAPTFVSGTSASSANPILNFSRPGIYEVSLRVAISGTSCTSTVFKRTIVVRDKPTVTLNLSKQSICVGDTLRPSVTASCNTTNATYSWSFPNAVPTSANTANPGSITFNNSGTNTISIAVTNSCGTTTSDKIITVNNLPTLTIPSNREVCAGTNTGSFNFTSNGSTIWTIDKTGIGITSNAQSGSGTLGAFTTINNTNTPIIAKVIVTAINGSCSKKDSFNITINPKPQIANRTQTICSNGSFTITPSNDVTNIVPTGTTYTWGNPISNPVGAITGGAAQATGVSSISQSLTNTTNASATLTYTVTPTSGTSGNCVGNTFTITVTVNPQAGISNQTTAICSGNAFSITPTGVPASTTYTWGAPTLPTGLAVTAGNTGNAQSSINATLTNNTTGALDAVFTVTPSSGGCGSGTFDITVTVNPKPNIAQQSITICSGNTFTITPTTTLVPTGTTYTWTAPSGSGFTGGAASSGSPTTITGTLTNSTNTVQTATYSIKPISGAGGSCEGSNFNTIVTINPKPSIPKQTRAICSGEPFSLNITNGSGTILPANTTYTWSAPTVTSGITGGISGTNATTVSGTLNNTTNTTQTATYTVTPTSGIAGNCVGDPFIVEITVNPKPIIGNITRTICSGNAFTVSPVDGAPDAATIVPTGTTYKWAAPSMPTGVTGGSAQTIGANSISQTLTNNTNTPKTVTYNVIPSIGSCDGASFTVTVTVNPTPKVIAQTREICSGNSFTLPLSNSEPNVIIPTGTTYTWAAPTGSDFTGGAAGNSQTIISGTLSNSTNTSKTATYTITPTSGTDGGCVGSAFNLVVTIHPIPSITTSSKDPTTCGSPTGSITISGLTNGVVYTVSYNNATGTLVNTNITANGTQYEVLNLVAGVYTNIRVTSLSCTSNIITSLELKDPTPPATPVATNSGPVCSGKSLTLSVSSPISGATYTWTGQGFAAQTTTTGSITINNTTTANNGQFTVTANVSGCNSNAGTTTVVVNQTPAKPTVATPVTYCQNVTATALSATALTGNTLQWWGTNATGGTVNTTAPTPSTDIAGTETFYVSQLTTATGCESERAAIVVTTNTTPAKPTITTPVTYCQGTTATALTATASTGNSLKWYTVATGGTASITAPIPSTSTIGTTEYYVSQITSASCEGQRDTIRVIVNETPANPVATTSIVYCQNATATALTATALTGNTLNWYTTPTGGTGDANAPTPSTTSVGTTSYYVSQITSLGCESGRTKIDVTINATPSAPTVTTPINYCIGNTATALTATATGNNTLNWYTVATSGTASSTAPTPTTTNAGSTNYYVSQTTPISFCEGARAKIEVIVKTTPIIDSANKSNPTTCATANGSIRIYVKELGNGNYSVNYKKDNNLVSVPSSIASNGVITLSNLFAGTYTDFSVVLDGCPSNVLSGNIILSDPNPPATPNIAAVDSICSGNTLSLSATSATDGVSFNWKGPNNFTSTVAQPSISNVTTAASGAYLVTATRNNCVSPVATFVVRVDSTPTTPTITTNAPLCFGSNLNLTSTTNFPSALQYAWTGPNNFTSSVQNPTILNASELASGTYSLTITSVTGSCSAAAITKDAIVRPLLTQAVISGADTVFVCNFNPPANETQNIAANLNATRPYETGKWTIISKPAGSTASFANDAAANTTITYDKSGLYQLQWAITNDVNCASTKDTVYLSIVDQPQIKQAFTATATNVCAGNPVTISVPNNAIVGAIKYWQFKRPYYATTWQDTLVTNPSITFNNVQDTFSVRLVVISTNQLKCSSDTAFKELTINVAPPSLPGVTTGVDTVCQGANSGSIFLAGNIGTPTWQSSTDGINFTNISNSAVQNYTYNNLTVTTWFRAAVKSGVCDTVFSNATKITVFPPVTNANAGLDIELCGDSTIQLNANVPSSIETGVWSFASGSATATIVTPNTANTVVSNMIPNTNYRLVWTLSNGICTNSSDEIEIKNYLPLTNTIDTSTITVCNSVVVNVTGNPPIGGNIPYIYQWQILQGSTWKNINGATNMSYTFTADTTVKIRRLVTAMPCTNVSLEKTIYVQPPLGNNTVTGNAETCINTSSGLLTGSLPTGADGNYFYQWQTLQGSIWTNISGATQKDYTVPVLTATSQYRRLVTSALCSGNQGIFSAPFEVIVRPDAKANWTVTKDTACAPFNINNTVVSPVVLPLQNGSYSWYANNIFYGNSATQNPGYTLNNAADSVTIKMVAVSLYGCKNDSLSKQFFTIPPVLTNFTVSDSSGCGPLNVGFQNTTPYLGFFTYQWNFGNNQFSNLQQPNNVVFATNPNFGDTTYIVSLTAKSECETVVKTKTVTVSSKPKSIFTPDKTIGCSPLTVNFTNISKGVGTSFIWDFGDGTQQAIGTKQSVNHIFKTGIQDTFRVQLISINQCGNDTAYYDIVVAPSSLKLDFAVNGTEKQGCNPHAVKFINASTGVSSFQWNFGDGNTLNTTKNIDTINHRFLQSGTFTVTVFATNGCTDTTATEVIQVFDAPRANFTATPLQACIGDTIRFTNQSDAVTSLLWNFKDSYTSSNTNPVHAFLNAGIYNVQLTAIRQYNSGLVCTDSIVRPISIVAKLPGLFTVTDSISNCVPFTATFTNQSLPSSLTTWNFAPGINDTGNVVTRIFTQVGTYNVTMSAKHPTGCTYEYAKNIVVRGPSGSITYDNGFICGNTPVRLEATVQNTDSIRWNLGDGTFITTNTPVIYHVYKQSGLYVPTATLLTNSLNSCSVLIKGVDTIRIDYLKAGFRHASLLTCGNTRVQFTDTSRKYLPIVSWRWSFGDGTFSTLQNPIKNYTASNNWQIQLIVTGASGCSDTITRNIFIKVNTTPSANINAAATACTNRPVQFDAQYVSADTVSIINWSFTNGVVLTGSPVTNFYLNTGTYTATLIVGTLYGCQDTVTKTITINQSPTITASADATICKGQSKQLTATGTTAYSWFPLDGSLSCTTCTNPIAKPLTTTQYIVTGTNNFGCTAIDTVVIKVAQPITVTVSPNDTICIGQTAALSVSGATTYVWSPANTLSNTTSQFTVATPTSTTRYRVIGFDSDNCFQDTGYVTVAVGEYPVIQLENDKTLATGTLLPLNYTATNGPLTSWRWTPSINISCDDCALPIATVKNDICYTLTGTNVYKCASKDTICIKVFCENTQVFIPNTFTPDNDGINDIFMVRGTGIKSIKSFRVFNRWGQVVFERGNILPNNSSQGWDGKIKGIVASPDVYIYTCEVVCENNVTYTYKGNVSIIK